MKINNKGYLIVEIIVASVLAMGLAYFLLELVLDLKNKNEDYYVNTLLETDKALMTREVMNDVSNYKIKSITSDNENFVEFIYGDGTDEIIKRITIDKDNKIFKYGIYENNKYFKDEFYFEKTFDSKLNVTGISITNKCYFNNSYALCSNLNDEEMGQVSDGLVTISIDAKMLYSDYNYGVELNIKYKRAVTIIKVDNDIIVNTSDVNKFNNRGNYDVSVTCTNANARWNYTNWQLDVYSIKSTDVCNVSFINRKDNLSQYIMNKVGTNQGNGKIVNENGYRYEGKDPNNYVLFNNELWRIIGVFDDETHGVSGQYLTKIIRNESIGGYAWTNKNDKNWENATLNTILNTYYYNSQNGTGQSICYSSGYLVNNCNFTGIGLDEEAKNMIQKVQWKLGKSPTSETSVDSFYEYERSLDLTEISQNIGLMYPSDYGYSVLSSNCARTTSLSGYNNSSCCGQSWLFKYNGEWTLTAKFSDNSAYVIYLNLYTTYMNYGYAVRPAAYLKSSTYIVSGDGTPANPYILKN